MMADMEYVGVPATKEDRTRCRKDFLENAKRFNCQQGVGSDGVSRAHLASRWQSWAKERVELGGLAKVAKNVSVEFADRECQGNWWYNKGVPPDGTPKQVTLSLRRGDTAMNRMFETSQTHPLLVVDDLFTASRLKTNWLMLDGKVNAQSRASDHESPYNIRCSTVMGFILDFGYSRYQDSGDTTHAWVSWHEALEEWQMNLAVDFLLNIVGYRGAYNSDGLLSGPLWVPKVAQPLAGDDMLAPGASVAQPLPGGDMVVQGASVAQPWVGRDMVAQRTSSSSGLPWPRPSPKIGRAHV